jgi:hypothetical protein
LDILSEEPQVRNQIPSKNLVSKQIAYHKQ